MIFFPVVAILGMTGVLLDQEPPPAPQGDRLALEEQVLRQLANPLSAMASIATILDFDYHIGPGEDGHRTTMFVQPTIPIHLGESWNVVSRTNLPIVYQEEISPGSGTQTGIGDLTEVAYLAKVQPGPRGWVWGGGPIVQIPIGSEDLLTNHKFSLGPSMAFVKQEGDFTYGVIASQLWSIGGSDQRPDVNVGLLDPFVTYRSEGLWNLTLHVPATYNFHAQQWTVPVSLTVEKLVSFQAMPVTITFGVRYWAEGPDSGPHDLAFRFGLTLVLPK
jgi:hypothetical protein